MVPVGLAMASVAVAVSPLATVYASSAPPTIMLERLRLTRSAAIFSAEARYSTGRPGSVANSS